MVCAPLPFLLLATKLISAGVTVIDRIVCSLVLGRWVTVNWEAPISIIPKRVSNQFTIIGTGKLTSHHATCS
jgi:hypothetical protein